MALFIKSRRLLLIGLFAVVIEMSLPLWAARAFKITHDSYLVAVPIAVLMQFVVVALLLYTVASNFARMDRLAARPMSLYQLGTWGLLAAPVAAATAAACLFMGDSGNIGTFAPLKALLGMWGLGLIATAMVDRRVAGVIPVIAILLPMVLNPAVVPGVAIWGFATEPDTSVVSWGTALGLLALGVIAHTSWSERGRR